MRSCVRTLSGDEQRFALAGIERERLGQGHERGIGLRPGFDTRQGDDSL